MIDSKAQAPFNTDNLPQSLKEHPYWCLWKYEERDGKRTKVPYNPRTGGKAQPNNRQTFTDYSTALHSYVAGGFSGLGIGLFDDMCAVDIDHCVGADGTYSDMAQDIISTMVSYTEFSPSGTGVRILFRAGKYQHNAKRYYTNNQKAGLEIYIAGNTKKFVTITGHSILDEPIDTRPEEIAAVAEVYMIRPCKTKGTQPKTAQGGSLLEHEIIAKASKARNGALFQRLMRGDTTGYKSHSEADQALCNLLAFWCAGDTDIMDKLYRQSGLYRPKWDEKHGKDTYGRMTLEKAVAGCSSFYNPKGAEYRTKVQQRAVEEFSKAAPIVINPAETPEARDRYTPNDRGNGYLFADSFKNQCRYCPDAKEWFYYTGRAWRIDTGGTHARELAKKLSQYLADIAFTIEDKNLQRLYQANAHILTKRGKREDMLKDAQSVYPIFLSQMDADSNLFNCQNGTLHLDTRTFTSHNPDDLISKVAGVVYDPDARCERWEKFMREVMEDDVDRITFLQKSFGYALLGTNEEECMYMLNGISTRNGKGTTMTTIMAIFGDYGCTAQPELLDVKRNRNSSGPSEDLARLRGMRLVNISEPPKNMRLDEAKVKQLTGRDVVNARFLNQNSFDFMPQFVIFINSNHRPIVTDDTLFASGRVREIPYNRYFAQEERDTGLKSFFLQQKNLSGIFNWMLEGLRLYQEQGLEPPQSVALATDDYRKDSDGIARFIDECIEGADGHREPTSMIYNRYKSWCSDNGHRYPETSKSFVQDLKAKGYTIEHCRFKGSEKISHLYDHRLLPAQTSFSTQANFSV